jgi:Trypsin-like peptidase domain/Effector-associated domain 8
MQTTLPLLPEEKVLLVKAIRRIALNRNHRYRNAMFKLAGIDENFVGALDVTAPPAEFAEELVAGFLQYQVSKTAPDHPLMQFLKYLRASESFQFNDQERALFPKLLQRGDTLFKSFALYPAVGRIESPLEHAIGTGVLINQNSLLTCFHIFEEIEGQTVWIRFEYTEEHTQGTFYELDFTSMNSDHHLDYAVLRMKGNSMPSPIPPRKKILDCGQLIYIMHYPQGRPLEVAGPGQITGIDTDSLQHDLPVEHGSSGAPIFDKDWQLVALHRGNPGMRHSHTSGITEGIPLSTLWNMLVPYLPEG